MKSYLLALTCPTCGGPVHHVNASKVTTGTDCCAIAGCAECKVEFVVAVQIRQMPRSSRFAA